MRQDSINWLGEAWQIKKVMGRRRRHRGITIAALGLLLIGASMGGCGGGGGGGSTEIAAVSPQIVSGVAATGAPLVGQVSLKDASSRPEKVTTIANDGSFAIDVADRTAPFILKATGTSDGVSRTLFSFADKPGTANINPLSNAAVANAAGVDDPAAVFDKPDAATLQKIKSAMPGSVSTLKSKLKILLDGFSAANTDPVKDAFAADHTGLDGMFDNVKIVLAKGTLTITNATTGAVIFTARVSDIANGSLTGKDDDLPKAGPRPAAAAGLKAVGGDAQVTVSWDAVANATAYDLFYSTRARVAEEDDKDDVEAKRVKNVTSPYVLKGLAASTTYYFIVRAINNGRRGPASAEVSATTSGTAPVATVPAAPTGLSATGGTKQTTLSWTAVTGATAYNLYWATSTGVTTASGTKISGVSSPAVQTGLADNSAYFYIVTAVNSAGESPASVQVAATTLPANAPAPTVPAAPSGVTVTGGANQATLAWPAVTGATSYNIYSSTASGVTPATGTRVAGVSSPFVQTGLAAGTTYFYVVTALNSAGESGPSIQVSASTSVAAIDGAALYASNCAGCHGSLATSAKRGSSAAAITDAIAGNRGGMGSISLTPEQIAAIAAALL